MSSSTQSRFIDRVQFFEGQRLLASDLLALEEYQREMRWLHNRSLHQPGVANGFAVYGEKGDPVLEIQPGYAIDVLGRELILGEPHSEPVPPVAGDAAGNPIRFDLTVSYSASLPASETRSAVCGSGGGAVRLREAPVFCWVRVDSPDADSLRKQIESGERVLLARVEVLNCQLYQRVSIVQRRNAKPSLHPFVFAAEANPDWEIEPDDVSPLGIRLKSKVPVDTSAAGFRTSPSYFVSLLNVQTIRVARDGETKSFQLEGFVDIYEVAANSFSVSVLVPHMLFVGSDLTKDEVSAALEELVAAHQLSWRLEWLGVEG